MRLRKSRVPAGKMLETDFWTNRGRFKRRPDGTADPTWVREKELRKTMNGYQEKTDGAKR